MKALDTVYRVEMTEAEIIEIETALHVAYKARRDAYRAADTETAPKLYKRMRAAQEARDALAGMIGKIYMGEDR